MNDTFMSGYSDSLELQISFGTKTKTVFDILGWIKNYLSFFQLHIFKKLSHTSKSEKSVQKMN